MENKSKKSIVGVILAASIVGSIITGGGFERLDVGNRPHWFTKNQYKELKNELVGKYLITGEFTIDEYQVFIAVMDKEAKKGKFKNVGEIEKHNLIFKIMDKIK